MPKLFADQVALVTRAAATGLGFARFRMMFEKRDVRDFVSAKTVAEVAITRVGRPDGLVSYARESRKQRRLS